jgi:hypothetical protein
MKNKNVLYAALPLLLAVGLSACTIKQEATLNPDGSGAVSFDFSIEPFFVDTLKEMAELTGDQSMPEGEVFNIPQIKKDFAEKDEVTLRDITSPKKDVLKGFFTFTNIEDVFIDQKKLTEAGIITLTKQRGNSILQMTLTKQNYKQVSDLFPIIDTPLFDMFGPQEGEFITEEEYFGMVELAFGEEGAKGLRGSYIELKVNVKGKILSQQGGIIRDGSVIFKIPLIKVLLLNEPLRYSVVFQ